MAMNKFPLHLALLQIFMVMEISSNGQSEKSEHAPIDRKPVVAGAFYPSSKSQLDNDIKMYFDEFDQVENINPLAIIVPHAGYVFSASVAASGFKQLDRDSKFKHIFLIGSSHTMHFNGAAIYTHGDFITPLGKVLVDPLAKELVAKHDMILDSSKPHEREHSLEVQLPFLQYWLKNDFSIIPIIVGGESQFTCSALAEILASYFTEENLFIISTDFSHYPTYQNAKQSDEEVAQAILSNSADQFLKTKLKNENAGVKDLVTAICGWTSVLTLLKITELRNDVEYKSILYRNSGDSPYGDKDRVVGYWAIAAVSKVENKNEFSLDNTEKQDLLKLARTAIVNNLKGERHPNLDEEKLSESLMANAGAFVTLRKEGQLRGCLGNFSTSTPLYKVVMSMAIAAATEDYRFERVSLNEIEDVDIEISVLTPMRQILNADEFIPGKHGIYIKKGGRSGTFLPQVGVETGWSKEDLLGHCARDKAFIGWDGWKDKDAELYVYEAIVFEEKEFTK